MLATRYSMSATGDSRRLQHRVDCAREELPLGGFGLELFPAGGGQRVVARPAVVVGNAPFGLHPAAGLEAAEGRG